MQVDEVLQVPHENTHNISIASAYRQRSRVLIYKRQFRARLLQVIAQGDYIGRDVLRFDADIAFRNGCRSVCQETTK